jgi:hypothetical protein
MSFSADQNRGAKGGTLFYHSFPRAHAGEDVVSRGLSILECAAKYGLVLAPEIVEWTQPTVAGNARNHHTVQQRICFTEISPWRVYRHSKIFGPFAIEWSIAALRRLGVIPVFYIPQALSSNPGLSSLGNSLVVQTFDSQSMADLLDNLNQVVTANPQLKIVTLRNSDPSGQIVNSVNVPAIHIRDLLTYLSYRAPPFSMMRDVLQGVSGLFYPTENLKHNKYLDYYRQREWRLIGNISENGQSLTRSPTPNEAQEIAKTGEEFWNKTISGGTHSFKRLDKALLYPTFRGSHILATASRVIVPITAISKARRILNSYGINVPVSTIVGTLLRIK